MNDKLDFFSGKYLRGDNYNVLELKQWYMEEKDAYFALYGSNDNYCYEYTTLNQYVFFRHLILRKGINALGFGSAYGDEFIPIKYYLKNLVILESSLKYIPKKIGIIFPTYVETLLDGKISLHDEQFDVITCVSVLHHIANVSFVFSELSRCLKPGGYLLVREPIVSMGDWNRKRTGLTKNERGIPKDYFLSLVKNNNLSIMKQSFYGGPLSKLPFFDIKSRHWVRLDLFVSKLISRKFKYHANGILDKIRPTAMALVLKKC